MYLEIALIRNSNKKMSDEMWEKKKCCCAKHFQNGSIILFCFDFNFFLCEVLFTFKYAFFVVSNVFYCWNLIHILCISIIIIETICCLFDLKNHLVFSCVSCKLVASINCFNNWNSWFGDIVLFCFKQIVKYQY